MQTMARTPNLSILFGNSKVRLLWLGLIVAIFILVIVAIMHRINYQFRESVKVDVMYRSQITAETMSFFFSNKIHSILVLERYKPIRNYLKESKNGEEARTHPSFSLAQDMLQAINGTFTIVDPIYDGHGQTSTGIDCWLAGISGNFLCSVQGVMDETSQPEPWHTKERFWYQFIEHSNDVAFSDIYHDIKFDVPCVSFVKKVSDVNEDGVMTDYGVIGMDLFMPMLSDIVRKTFAGGTGKIVLIDGKQNIVYHSDLAFKAGRNLSQLGTGYAAISEKLKEQSLEEKGAMLVDIAGVSTYAGFCHIPLLDSKWYIINLIPRRVAEENMSNQLRAFTIAVCLVFLLFVAPIALLLFLERQRMAEAIQAQFAAEQANRAKSRFLSNMSHEIRTPMTAILGYTEMFNDPTTTRDGLDDASRTIQSNVKYLLQILDDILDFSKIDADKMKVNIDRVELATILDDVMSLFLNLAYEKRLDFSIENTTKIPRFISTDPVRLKQILLNLIGNAFKFTEQGSVAIKISWIPKPTRDLGHSSIFDSTKSRILGKGDLQIRICDTGIGIASNSLKTIFEPFRQADNSTTRRFEGTGLGLAISYRLANLMNGNITVESELKKGSVFCVHLYQEIDNHETWLDNLQQKKKTSDPPGSADTAEVSVPSKANPLPLDGVRILLAEDGPDNQRLFNLVLTKAGAFVTLVDNGKDAVISALESATAGRPYQLIIMDMQMPIMDGYTAVKELRKAGYRYPIIALTAYALPEEMKRCIETGCDDYANKPILRNALIEVVQKNLK